MTDAAALVELKGVSKSYADVEVLQNINLSIFRGEFLSVLGPSGSGKSTILRTIGGFEKPTSGQVLLNGSNITELPPNRRPFNTVFQDYALFPHLTVEQNVDYGVRVQGVPRAERRQRVSETLQLVELEGFTKRYPNELSGGQKQRAALARSIVCRPTLILLDEPLAALDLKLRQQMQGFLKNIQREINTSFVFVTHDQEEAIFLGDRVCVVDQGQILQIDKPEIVYFHPLTRFVAEFMGENNILTGVIKAVSEETLTVKTKIGDVSCVHQQEWQSHIPALNTQCEVTFRPESVILFEKEPSESSNLNYFSGQVSSTTFHGPRTDISVVLPTIQDDEVKVNASFPSGAQAPNYQIGDIVFVAWHVSATGLLAIDRQTQ